MIDPKVIWHGPGQKMMRGDHSFFYIPEGETGGPAVHIGTPLYHHADIAREGIHRDIDESGWDEDRFPQGSIYEDQVNMDTKVPLETRNMIAKALGLPEDEGWEFDSDYWMKQGSEPQVHYHGEGPHAPVIYLEDENEIHVGEPGWSFFTASTNWQVVEGTRDFRDFDSNMQYEHDDPDTFKDLSTKWNWRRPFVVDPKANTVYLGKPGTHHDNIEEEFELGLYGGDDGDPNHLYEPRPYGWAMDDPAEPHTQGGLDRGPETPGRYVALYGDDPDNQWGGAVEAVRNHLDLPKDPEWKFASKAVLNDWEPGMLGKGMFIDGVPHVWKDEDHFGVDHHPDYLLRQRGIEDIRPTDPQWDEAFDDSHGSYGAFYVDNHGRVRASQKLSPEREQQLRDIGLLVGDERWNFEAGRYDFYDDHVPRWERDKEEGGKPWIEWMHPEDLWPYREYDRSLADHDDLREHVDQYGLKDTVKLEYNPDTGHVHIGEGNHRTKMALEQGWGPLPVEVNRGYRKPSQGAGRTAPITLEPDQFGYVPGTIRPSELGLPTVDPPERYASLHNADVRSPEVVYVGDKEAPISEDHALGVGKSERYPIIYAPAEGKVYVGGYNQHHFHTYEQLGLDDPVNYRWHGKPPSHILGSYTPSGANGFYSWFGREPDDQEGVEKALADRMGWKPAAIWNFSNVQADWEPGNFGKGWVLDDGSILTWSVDEQDRKPYHMDLQGRLKMMGRKPLLIKDDEGWTTSAGAFQIDKDGGVHRLGKPLEPEFLEHILREDPRLVNPYGQQDPWRLSRVIPNERWAWQGS